MDKYFILYTKSVPFQGKQVHGKITDITAADIVVAPVMNCKICLTSENTCKGCKKLEMKLGKTLSECFSAQEVIKFLQRDANFNNWTPCESMCRLKTHQDRDLNI
jgi:hypothetical protein